LCENDHNSHELAAERRWEVRYWNECIAVPSLEADCFIAVHVGHSTSSALAESEGTSHLH